MAPWLDILWRIGTWGVVALGAVVVLLALFADAYRGWRTRRRTGTPRLRCPGGWARILWLIPVRAGCWYDMGGLMSEFQPGKEPDTRVRCPECGRRHKPRRLRAARRRWGIAALGLVVALLGLGGRYSREVYQRGWSAVPGEVLVLVPFDERTWLETGSTGAHWLIEDAAQEIAARDAEGRLSDWAAAHLGQRVQRRYMRDPDYGVDDASRAVFARLESTPFTQGIDARPFAEAVRTIAAVAGVQIEVDEAALAAAHIESERPVTVPPFGLMTCEQALDWACDRARARQGWAKGEWDVRDGRVVVTDDGSVYARRRVVVLTELPAVNDMRWVVRMIPLYVAHDRWSGNGGTEGHLSGVQRGLIVSIASKDALRVERFISVFRGEGSPASRDDAGIVRLESTLEAAPISPVGPDDPLDVLLHRLRSEAGLSVRVDAWGLNLFDPLPIATAAPSRNAIELLAKYRASAVQDGNAVVVALRAQRLLSVIAAYPIPVEPPFHDPDESAEQVNQMGGQPPSRDWRVWREQNYALLDRVSSEVRGLSWRVQGGDGASIALGAGVVVVQAAPDIHALTARVIEQYMAENPDWTVPPAGAAPE